MVCPITYGDHKQKPGLVSCYDIRPGNGDGLFLFWYFINLSFTYLLTYTLTHLDPHGAPVTAVVNVFIPAMTIIINVTSDHSSQCKIRLRQVSNSFLESREERGC